MSLRKTIEEGSAQDLVDVLWPILGNMLIEVEAFIEDEHRDKQLLFAMRNMLRSLIRVEDVGFPKTQVSQTIGVAIEDLREGDIVRRVTENGFARMTIDVGGETYTMGESVTRATFLAIDQKTGKLVAARVDPSPVVEEEPTLEVHVGFTDEERRAVALQAAVTSYPTQLGESRESRLLSIIRSAKRFDHYIKEGD